MFLEKINIEKKLLTRQNRISDKNEILKQVNSILKLDNQQRTEIGLRLNFESEVVTNNFEFDLLETDKIFHIDAIKSICVDYRMRFLDSNLFKNEIPQEAISKIKHLENSHNTMLNGFKIMAPGKLFKLKNYDDPLLFAPIGNEYYYLIHKWGNDMNPYRKFAMLPFKSMGNLLLTTLLLSAFTALILPINKLTIHNETTIKFISFLFIFKSYCAIILYYSFWKGKNFSNEVWNSKFYN